VGNEPVQGVWFVVGRQNDRRAEALEAGAESLATHRLA
jgi:hypothetical protein